MTIHSITLIQFIVRLTLGLIFVGSALGKLRDPGTFVHGVLDYEILPRGVAHVFGLLLPYVELGTAVLLISGFYPAIAASLALLLLVSFAIALGINARRGRAIPCHCFGAAATSLIGWHSLLRDVILLPFASWLLWVTIAEATQPPNVVAELAPAIGIAVICALAYALVVESFDLLINMPAERSLTEDIR